MGAPVADLGARDESAVDDPLDRSDRFDPRAGRRGKGRQPTTAEEWIEAHRDVFVQARDRAPAATG